MLIYWLLPMILLLGVITSYEDIKYGKIRNKWIFLALIYAFIVYHILFFFHNVYFLTVNNFYILIANGILSIVVGAILWRLGMWTAADAKLFFAFMILLPPALSFGRVNFYFFDYLVNTFIPLGIYLVFSTLEKTSFSSKINHVKEILKIRKLFPIALFIFVLTWPLSILARYIEVEEFSLLFVLIVALLVNKRKMLYAKNGLIVLGTFSIIRLFFDPTILFFTTWISFFWIIFIFVLVRFFLIGLSYEAFTKPIPFKSLKPGMVAAEIILKKGKIYKKEKVQYGFHRGMPMQEMNYLFKPSSVGLTKVDIKHIKSLSTKMKINDLRIQETISFAPFLFIGALLQLFLNGNVVTYIGVLIALL